MHDTSELHVYSYLRSYLHLIYINNKNRLRSLCQIFSWIYSMIIILQIKYNQLSLQFSITKEDNPCVFYENDTVNSTHWSTRGCKLLDFTETKVICHCNHTSDFAVFLPVSWFSHNYILNVFVGDGTAYCVIRWYTELHAFKHQYKKSWWWSPKKICEIPKKKLDQDMKCIYEHCLFSWYKFI